MENQPSSRPPGTAEEEAAATEFDLNNSEPPSDTHPFSSLINKFCEITSASPSEAVFYLESHNFILESAVSTFLETAASSTILTPDGTTAAAAAANNSNNRNRNSRSQSPVESESYSPSQSQSSSPSRSRSPSPPPARRSQYNLRSSSSKPPAAVASGRRTGAIRTLADLNRQQSNYGSDSESDEPQNYYTGGEKSGMLVQDPSNANNVDAIFNQARQSGSLDGPLEHLRPSSSSRSFTGTARLLSGETASLASQQPQAVIHNIIFWRNGFTVDDGPLRGLDDPENASFLESIRRSECPKELEPVDKRTAVHVNLIRKQEDCPVPEKPHLPFQGVGRTLASTNNTTSAEPTTATTSITTASAPSVGLVVDQALPSTSIQLRLADGTRMVSRFNYSHTIRDIRGFIDASRPGGSTTYQLRTVGFPPKLLDDLEQTIEQAGLANSVVIQKL